MDKKDTKLNEHSVKVNNRNLKAGEELFTTRELYLYSFLETRTNIRGLVETSLSLINRKIKFVKTEYRNKKIIKETLESLRDKIAINIIEEDGEIYDIEMFEIEDNFTFVEYSKVEELREEELFIYTIVKRFEDFGEYNLSYSKWSELLRCSKSHAVNTINKAVENKVIYKKVNNYTDKTINNQKIQETSTYSLNNFAKDIKSEEESQEEPKQQKQQEDTETSTDNEPLVVQHEKIEETKEQENTDTSISSETINHELEKIEQIDKEEKNNMIQCEKTKTDIEQTKYKEEQQEEQQSQLDTSQSQNQNGLSDINAMLAKELNDKKSQKVEVTQQQDIEQEEQQEEKTKSASDYIQNQREEFQKSLGLI